MDIKNLITLKTIVDAGSFQKAAELLNFAQSTITFQIQQLEQELDIKLFDRIGRKMHLTDAGRLILPNIEAILDNIAMIKSFSKRENNLSGRLSVAMPETLLTYEIQKTLKLFSQKAPDVQLSLQMQNCYQIRDQVQKGEIDFGIHYDVGGYSQNIYRERLAEFDLVLVCSPGFNKAENDFITPHQQKNVCLLSPDKNSIFFSRFLRYLTDNDISFKNLIELSSIEAIKRSVAGNLGVSLLPRFTVENELEFGILNTLETNMDNKKITAILSYHKNKWISPAMELFISLLKDDIIYIN